MAKKKRPATAKRQVFLQALEVIRKARAERDEVCFMELANKLSALTDEAPKSGWLAEEWAICSALWAIENIDADLCSVDDIDEHCKGGEMFLVAYFLGRNSALSSRASQE